MKYDYDYILAGIIRSWNVRANKWELVLGVRFRYINKGMKWGFKGYLWTYRGSKESLWEELRYEMGRWDIPLVLGRF